MLLILDTSILIATLLSRNKTYARTIIGLAKKEKVALANSQETFQEFKEKLPVVNVTDYPYYNPRVGEIFVAWYQYNTQFFATHSDRALRTLRDSKDNIFLQLAEASEADYVITGDKDLLVLKRIGKTKIVKPQKFIRREFAELL